MGLHPSRSLLVAPLMVGAIGCGSHGSAGDRPNGSTVAAVIKGVDNPFFATMREGLEDGARSYRASLRVAAAAGLDDSSGQASALEGLIEQGSACYIVNPINPSNLIPPLQHVPRGIPVVNVDSPIDLQAARAVGVSVATYIGTDNEAAGRKASTALARMVGQGARVALITGIPGDVGSADRARGFRLGARAHLNVTREIAADFDRMRASDAMAGLLRDDQTLAGVFAVNDEMALGAAAAVRRTGRRVSVVGMDGTREALRAIKRGALQGTIVQYPFVMGRLAIEACTLRERGGRLPSSIVTPVGVVTAANVVQATARFPRPLRPVADPLAARLGH